MSTRALLKRSPLGACLAVAAALVSFSCGGGAGPDGLTGPEATAARVATEEDAVVSASQSPELVDVCHYDAISGEYFKLSLPAPALGPHLGHGDFERPNDGYDCTQGPPASCPCYTADGLDQLATSCDGTAPQCLFGLRVICVKDGPDSILAGLSVSGSPLYCESSELETIELSEEEYQACLGELDKSELVTFGPSVCGAP